MVIHLIFKQGTPKTLRCPPSWICLLLEWLRASGRQGRVWVVDGCKRVKKLCEVWSNLLFATDDPVTCCDQILCESEKGLFSRDGVIFKICK